MNPAEPERTENPTADAETPPPFLGSWVRVYAAVGLWALLIMILLVVFSSWSF